MGINEMVQKLKSGAKLRRKGSVAFVDGSYVDYIDGKGMIVHPSGEMEIYLPTDDDMEYDDWEEVSV